MKKKNLRIITALITVAMMILMAGCNVNININDQDSNIRETASGSDNGNEVNSEAVINTSVMKPWINSNIIGLVTDDVNANIKDDFYLNVNHDYLRDAKLRPGYAAETPTNDAQKIVKDRCFDILNDRKLTGRDAQMVQDYYDLFLDWDARNEAGIEPMMPFVEELKKVETIDEMTDFLLSDTNFTYGIMLSKVEVCPYISDSTQYMAEIINYDLSLDDSAEYSELTEYGKSYKTFRECQLSYMLKRAGFTEEESRKYIADMFSLEKKLSEHIMTKLEQSASDSIQKMINPVTMEDIKKMSPHYPLAEYMEKRGYSHAKHINLDYPEWLKSLDSLYNDENLDEIKAFILARSLGRHICDLDEEAFCKYRDFINELYELTETQTYEEAAYNEAMNKFPDSFSRIYIDKYLNEEIREEIRQLCQDAIDTYYEMLADEDWMSEETREAARNKLKNISIHAVYPDKWKDDSMYHVTPSEKGGNYFQAVIDYAQAKHEEDISHINGTVDKDLWSINILETNAFYSPQENSINIIPGYFCDASYSSDMSIEEKYGALGTVIGHEISHAFDTTGAQFDADGNFINWWTEDDFNAFLERADKLIAFYDDVVVLDNETPYKGQMVQTEAIADLAGMKCMLKMAEKIEDFDYDKFFRAFEYFWAEVDTIPLLERRIQTDPHPLSYLRGNVTVQQFDEFLETYDIREGDGMYLAPEDRIMVW